MLLSRVAIRIQAPPPCRVVVFLIAVLHAIVASPLIVSGIAEYYLFAYLLVAFRTVNGLQSVRAKFQTDPRFQAKNAGVYVVLTALCWSCARELVRMLLLRARLAGVPWLLGLAPLDGRHLSALVKGRSRVKQGGSYIQGVTP